MIATNRAKGLGLGILGLTIGYFLWYTPYAGLAKALSSGLLPGLDGVSGATLLPATALGAFAGTALFLGVSGWWRYALRHPAHSAPSAWPRRTTLVAGWFTALIIATTTLNYTFAGVSILFMLLMMRGGVLALSPVMDAVRRRRVHPHSWLALGLSLLAVSVALADVNTYHLTAAALASLGVYLFGYIGRFEVMSRVAANADAELGRRYLVEEQTAAFSWQLALCGLLALVTPGAFGAALREGFTGFLLTPAAVPAFAIGLLYAGLYVYGTRIYLHPREFTWCVPANRCASLLSGVVASYGLAWLTGIAAPGPGQLVATGLITVAIVALCAPALGGLRRRRSVPLRLLFVCGGNTGRSAMAEAIARAELDGESPRRWTVSSAGLTASARGAPMAGEAVEALRAAGVSPHRHRSRQLTARLCRASTAVYCMTRDQREAVVRLAPEAGERTFCLDPARDIPDPATAAEPAAAYRHAAELIRGGVRRRLAEHDHQHQPVGG